jgi:hypothetical protein
MDNNRIEELVSTLLKLRYLFLSMNMEPPTDILVSDETLRALSLKCREGSETVPSCEKTICLSIAGIKIRTPEYGG